MSGKIRFAVVVSHAIPYYAPYYRALTKHAGIDVRVFFASRVGIDKTFDPGLGRDVVWQTDLLNGYDHTFLPEAPDVKELTFSKVDNPSISRALTEYAPDVVLLHGYTQKTMLRALAWCRRNGVPALMISDSSLHAGSRLPMRMLKKFVLPFVFRQFGAFLSIGDANQRYLETYGVSRSRIFRVPNMVDEGYWAYRVKRDEERVRIRRELGISDDELVVLYVGKLIERKRPRDILAALAHIKSMTPSARSITAIFAGSGAQSAELQRFAADEKLPARFLGFVNIDVLPGFYCAADLLAHPAEIEVFGVIVLEAAILGLPLVLSDHVGAIGPTSVARPGQNALIHPCGDVSELATLLHRLANEPQTLAAMAGSSLQISEELDWRMVVRNTLAAIDYCIHNRKAFV